MVQTEVRKMIIGIDFGTCFSSAAIMSGLIPVTNYMKRDTTGMGIPSLFMYSEEDGKELYGEDCATGKAYRHASDIVRYMKRTVREDPANMERTITSGGMEYTIQQVIEKYLTFLVSEVRMAAVNSGEFQNTDIEAVTITAPVGISSGQMMATDYNRFLRETMMRITGLGEDRVRVLQEPVAAAISYLYSEDIRKRYDWNTSVVVFDLGGGTLDVTVMEHNPRTMEYTILAKEGDLQLGGNDWDAALRKAVLEKVGVEWSGTEEESVLLDRAVTELKVNLSDSEESMIFFTMDGEDRYTRFSRQEFEECTKDLLERAMGVLEKALTSDLLPEGFSADRIVLVGGSSNMPMIPNGIKGSGFYTGEDVLVFEPSKAIAKGAAVFMKMNHSNGGSAMGPKVVDMVSHTYGFSSRYGGYRDGIYNMIYKGDRFDDSGMVITKSDTSFIPREDDQTVVSFNIFESECLRGEGFDENWFDEGNGETFNGLHVSVQVPPEYIGRARAFAMWVKLTMDTSGILTITVTDRAGNKLAYASSVEI